MVKRGLFISILMLYVGLANAQCNFNSPHQAGANTDASAYNRNVTIDGGGNIIVFGNFHGTAVFQSYTLPSPSSNNMYLAKFSPQGTVLWAKMITNTSYSNAADIVVDQNDNIYITGNYQSTLSFGGISISEFGPNRQVFLAKYNSSGVPQWAKTSSGNGGGSASGSEYGHHLSTDEFDNVYLTGSFDNTFSIDAFSFTASNSVGDFFIAKFDGAGTTEWVTPIYRSVVSALAPFILADGDGSYYLVGNFTTYVVVGGIYMNNYPEPYVNNSYVAKFTADSTLSWINHFKGDHYIQSAILDANKEVVIAGSFKDTLFVNGDTIFSQFNNSLFVGKVASNGNLKSLGKAASTPYGNQLLVSTEGLVQDNGGNIYLTGWYTGSINFNGMFISDTSDFYYLAKFDSSLNIFWVNSFGVSKYTRLTGMVKINNCNPVVHGSFYEQISIDTINLSTLTWENDLFLVEFDDNSGELYMDTSTGPPAPIISTNAIAGSPFCPSDLIDISFTVVNAFNSGNVFTAELSDSLGSFSSPTNLGSVNGTTSGIINTVLPPNVEPGASYRVRITASDPGMIADDNGLDLVIKECGVVPGISSNGFYHVLRVFPNPNSGKFSIELTLKDGASFKIELINSIGQIVFSESGQQSNADYTLSLDLVERVSGVYLIRIQTGTQIIHKKIIVE